VKPLSLRRLRWLDVAGVLTLVAVGIAAAGYAAGSQGTGATQLLPDLDQEVPAQLQIRIGIVDGRPSYLLGFRSAVRNVGSGPLIIDGHRRIRCGSGSSCGTDAPPTMWADQLIRERGGSLSIARRIGRLTFVRSSDHDHWHLAGFDRYELRRNGTDQALISDRKSGFCLGDRYPTNAGGVAGAPPHPVYTGQCGLGRPDLTHLREGISVGYGDVYAAYLEYQSLPLDGLPDGRYVLVHRANADHRLREMSYANNAASLVLDLRWQRGQPYVVVIAACPDSATCTPPALDDGHP